jgi:AAA domain-containing protein
MSADAEAPGKPELDVVGDVYRLTWPCGIEAELDRFSEHDDALSAEVTIRSSRPPRPGLLHTARFNLMSTQARKTLASALRERDDEIDWGALIEGMCFVVRERYRNGEPAVDLRDDIERPAQRWLVEPFVEHEGATVLFADGGTGKSFIALAIAISASSEGSVIGKRHADPRPVLYLDWETSRVTAQERLDAILAGAGIRERPPIFYRRMSASLVEAAANLRREVAERGVGLVVVDALGAARAGEPESADITIRLFNAARSLGVPWLGVDHVTKANGNDSTRPFGSTYTHNLARLTWSADKAQEEGEDTLVVALTNRKRNNGRLLPRRGYRLEFVNASRDELKIVRFHSADLTGVPGLSQKLPIKQRILAELGRTGPMKIGDLAVSLEWEPRSMSARVGELVSAEKLVRLNDGTDRVALRAAER